MFSRPRRAPSWTSKLCFLFCLKGKKRVLLYVDRLFLKVLESSRIVVPSRELADGSATVAQYSAARRDAAVVTALSHVGSEIEGQQQRCTNDPDDCARVH